jgi:hypothetical protein
MQQWLCLPLMGCDQRESQFPTPYGRVETKAMATVVDLKEPQIIIILLFVVVSADEIWWGDGGEAA